MEIAAIFLPLAAAILALGLAKPLGDRGAQLLTCGAVLVSAGLGIALGIDVCLHHAPRIVPLFTWIKSGALDVAWTIRYDQLTAMMVVVVTVVSAMVHVYAIGYMAEDPSKPRFMAYLSLFTFMMLMLVTANDFVQLFFGWEGVGLASYLLIGFWYEKPSANAAAMKAFIVNRVGDFGFMLGIAAVFAIFGALDFKTVFAAAQAKSALSWTVFGIHSNALTAACLLLFVGAMGKSAQLGLHTWLPDAMEGPTPVSALIHAATMVTAGVFMLVRCSPMFEYAPAALEVVCVVGALTAFVAATIGLTQFDIKRVIAYSTMSQLGYMFFAIGVSAYQAAMFHLFTHAFFKALLFLCAGSVIHALHGEQDMRKMGGLFRKVPKTATLMWIGSLALAGIGIPGVYGFAGFYSKDMILEAAEASGSGVGHFAFWLGEAAALMTAFYSWRLLFLTFHGKFRGDHHALEHAHESPPVMLWPLYVLGAGALLAGIVGYNSFVGEGRGAFFGDSVFVLYGHDSIEKAHHAAEWPGLLTLALALIGIGAAWLAYIRYPGIPGAIVAEMRSVYTLVYRKWFFDEIYDLLIVRPAKLLGLSFWHGGDEAVINRFGPDGISGLTRTLAGRIGRLQTGYVYHYAFVMLVGMVAFVSWYLYRGGVH